MALQPQNATSATNTILESISDGVFTVDKEWRITSFNRAAERITGVSRKDALGRLCGEVFRSTLCGAECALRRTLHTARPIIGKSAYIINADGERVPISISTAVLRDDEGHVMGGAEVFRDLSEIEALLHELKGGYRAGALTSRSPIMQRIIEALPAIAASNSTVLVQGETGTGKELVARTIHDLSNRKEAPFVAVNCGALPDTLLESELFGYKAGAFTGAVKDKPGRFALAHSGTIFLDEIGEITPALQVRLLRVLQERVFEPLGSTRQEQADVRVIAATNRDLQRMTLEGEFREDLYYRINVVRIELPPLRNRQEDIPRLAQHFITRQNRLQGREITRLSPAALSLFMAYEWPGNIRELENIIEYAFILCDTAQIEINHLPPEIRGGVSSKTPGAPTPHREARDMVEAQMIESALATHNGNCQAAAIAMGMHKTTLYRKMRRFGIKRDGTR